MLVYIDFLQKSFIIGSVKKKKKKAHRYHLRLWAFYVSSDFTFQIITVDISNAFVKINQEVFITTLIWIVFILHNFIV